MLASEIPTLVVRYEDLIQDPESVLTDVFKFLLNTDSLQDSIVENLIKEQIKPEKELYYKRDPSGETFDKFSEDQRNYFKSSAGCVLRRLGYGKNFITPVNPISNTDYFENDDYISESKVYELDTIVKNREEREIKVRYDYIELNKNSLAEVRGRQEMDRSKLAKFKINNESEKLRATGIKKCLRPYKLLLREMSEC